MGGQTRQRQPGTARLAFKENRSKQTKTVEDNLSWEVQVRKVEVILGVNGVAMDRHGLILWENEAAGSRKVFRYLLDLRDTIF